MTSLKPLNSSSGASKWAYLLLKIQLWLHLGFRQRTFVFAVMIGVLGALAAHAFKVSVDWIHWGLTRFHSGNIQTFLEMDWKQRLLVPTVGSLLAGLMAVIGKKLDSRKATDYMEALTLGNGDIPFRPNFMRSLAAAFSIGSGVSIGREGPLVQMASMVGSILGRIFKEPPSRLRLLVACGASAGVAAAYNAPIGGALFVAEIIIGSLTMESFGPLLISSMTAVLTIRVLEPSAVRFFNATDFSVDPVSIFYLALLGVICGVLAPLYLQILRGGKQVFKPLKIPLPIKLMIGGAIFGCIAIWVPQVAGNGQSAIRSMLDGQFTWQMIGIIGIMKILAVTVVFGSGAVGGVFTPSMLVGAVSGYLWITLLNKLGIANMPPELGLIVGMSAFLSGAIHAPVMAIFMVFEMTLNPSLILPLISGAVVAYFVSKSFGVEGLYAASLRSGPRSVFDKDLSELRIRDILRPIPVNITPTSSFGQIANLFLRSGEEIVPVIDENKRLAGVVELQHIRPFLKDKELADSVITRDVMHQQCPVLEGNMDLPAALRLFSHNTREVLPVCEEDTGVLMGVISKSDLYLIISELTRREGVRQRDEDA